MLLAGTKDNNNSGIFSIEKLAVVMLNYMLQGAKKSWLGFTKISSFLQNCTSLETLIFLWMQQYLNKGISNVLPTTASLPRLGT